MKIKIYEMQKGKKYLVNKRPVLTTSNPYITNRHPTNGFVFVFDNCLLWVIDIFQNRHVFDFIDLQSKSELWPTTNTIETIED